MSRFITEENGKYIEEIESLNICKYRINDVCCNENSEYLGEWAGLICENDDWCGAFEKEDGIMKGVEQNG